jgi:hypothetical protein
MSAENDAVTRRKVYKVIEREGIFVEGGLKNLKINDMFFMLEATGEIVLDVDQFSIWKVKEEPKPSGVIDDIGNRYIVVADVCVGLDAIDLIIRDTI